MKKILFLTLGLLYATLDTTGVSAAARAGRPAGRGGAAPATSAGSNAKTTASKPVSARAATNAKTAPKAGAPAAGKTGGRTTSARSGTTPNAPAANTKAAPKTGAPAVSARAAKKQSVISTGTKVQEATQNTVVSEECRNKYEGCMDSFCMLDNESGGRCLCSDRNVELDAILLEIEKLDDLSYQMATLGVEKLEMGEDADAAIAKVNEVVNSIKDSNKPAVKEETKKKKTLDLSLWTTPMSFEDDEEDAFAEVETYVDPIDGKQGDELQKAAAKLCKAQMPECEKDINMLQMMYVQRIKSDCTAYENVMKQKKTQSAQKLQAAEKALRETAFEKEQNANKFDLGQCTIAFKECMQTTAGCGTDFSGCATISALDSTSTVRSTSKAAKNYQIRGAVSSIEVSASTYDALMAKKPLCETVLKQCTKVADQVWDVFMREVAPQLKSAELIAEDKSRQSCIGNVSDCFKKACKDNMDPNDPDGSYDMCLSRPETMLFACKVPLNNCAINAESKTAAMASPIWGFIVARLNAMRVDACSTEVRDCIQSEDVCGKDYTNCIGLDTYTIMGMCHRDKLTACYSSSYGDTVTEQEEYIYSVAQGLILNIDNKMIEQCQEAVNKAMIKTCGSTDSCESMSLPNGVGQHALEYKICQDDGSGNYSACVQDISLISDKVLLGEATLDDASQSYLDLADKYRKEAADLIDNGETLSGEVKLMMAKAMENRSKAHRVVTYDGPPMFSGVIDGTIKWNKITFSLEQPDANCEITLDVANNNKTQKHLCATGLSSAVGTAISSDKADAIASDLGSLKNAIMATIQSIENDPQVQYCMTGRKVQGLDKGKKITSENTDGEELEEGRFPGLTDSLKTIIAQTALRKAQANYDKKYKELQTKISEENVKLAQRIVEVRKAQELKDKIPVLAASCLGQAISIDGSGGDIQGEYSATSSNDEPYFKETTTITFNTSTLVCRKCVRKQNCTDKRGYKDCCKIDSRYCKAWEDPVEECTDTQY